jgi:hypothetical protein
MGRRENWRKDSFAGHKGAVLTIGLGQLYVLLACVIMPPAARKEELSITSSFAVGQIQNRDLLSVSAGGSTRQAEPSQHVHHPVCE